MRLREDWIERLRMKCDVDRLLTEVALKQKCHRVEVVFDGGIWHLVGCACGVNGAREELMQRKKTLENLSTEDEIYLRTCSNTCLVQEDRSPVMLPERSRGSIVTCEEKLASRENGKSKASDAANDGGAGRCDAEQGNMDAVRQSATHGQGNVMKKNSPKTNERTIQQRDLRSLEQNPRGNSGSGEGSKDRNDGTTKGPEKDYTRIRGHEQRDEVSKVKIDANKEKSAADGACSSVTTWWTQKQNSTQLKPQENPPKASGGDREISDTESSSDVQTTTNSDEQRDRVCALRMLHNVADSQSTARCTTSCFGSGLPN